MYRCWGGLGLNLRARLWSRVLGLFRKRVNPEGHQPRIFTGRTDAEAPVLWPSDPKS